jgi:hypothetical protein
MTRVTLNKWSLCQFVRNLCLLFSHIKSSRFQLWIDQVQKFLLLYDPGDVCPGKTIWWLALAAWVPDDPRGIMENWGHSSGLGGSSIVLCGISSVRGVSSSRCGGFAVRRRLRVGRWAGITFNASCMYSSFSFCGRDRHICPRREINLEFVRPGFCCFTSARRRSKKIWKGSIRIRLDGRRLWSEDMVWDVRTERCTSIQISMD